MQFYFFRKFRLPYEYYFSLVILALNIKNQNIFPNIPDAQNTYGLQMIKKRFSFIKGKLLVGLSSTKTTVYTSLLTALRVYTVFACLQKQAQSLYYKKGFKVSDKCSVLCSIQEIFCSSPPKWIPTKTACHISNFICLK